MEKQHQSAVKALQKCGLPLQEMLKCKMALLEAEEVFYREMRERLRKEMMKYFEEEL